MNLRQSADAGLETAFGCRTFRAPAVTDYLTNGGKLEVAQRSEGLSSAKTIRLHDRKNDDIIATSNLVQKIGQVSFLRLDTRVISVTDRPAVGDG